MSLDLTYSYSLPRDYYALMPTAEALSLADERYIADGDDGVCLECGYSTLEVES